MDRWNYYTYMQEADHWASSSKFSFKIVGPTLSTLERSSSSNLPTSFRESKKVIAVDTSGSTYDEALDAEKRAIQSIRTLVPRNLRSGVMVLPWNDEAGEQFSVNSLDSLHSGGGTEPGTLLEHAGCRQILKGCDFLFLMTDGLIPELLVHDFARLL